MRTNTQRGSFSIPIMLNELLELDRELFMFLNGFHAPWMDPIMVFVTDKLVWIPLYIALLYLIVKQLGKQAWIAVVAIALTVVIADQVTSAMMKPYFERLRPSHEPALENLVHIVDGYRGGRYGFASSHAANTFGVAMLCFLLLRQRIRWIWILFLWAALVTYSRIYLGVHYPGDILVGGLVGVIAGWISFFLFRLTKEKLDTRNTGLSRSAE